MIDDTLQLLLWFIFLQNSARRADFTAVVCSALTIAWPSGAPNIETGCGVKAVHAAGSSS